MIRCLKFRAYTQNTLKGFADLALMKTGLVLRDCTFHESHGKEWVGFPAKSFEGADGATKWVPIVEFLPDATQAKEQFQKLAVEAIHDFIAQAG